jgi:hypothetical protein
LVFVLIVVAMLSFSAYEMSHWVSIEADTSILLSKQVQARYLAESGSAVVETLALLKARGRDVPEPVNVASLFEGISVPIDVPDDGTSTESATLGRFAVYVAGDGGGEQDRPSAATSEIRWGTESEGGRLHFHHVVYSDPFRAEETLMKLPGATREIVQAILDWTDGDDDKREVGAERDDYERLDPPITPRNGPIESIEELLLVKGVTPELLYGEDFNRNGRLDPEEDDGAATLPMDNQDGKLDRGWSSMLTLYSRETNVDSKGRPRIFVNDGEWGRLYGRVSQTLGVEWARFLVAARAVGLPDAPIPDPEWAHEGFRIESLVALKDASIVGDWNGKPVSIDSPLLSTSDDFGEQWRSVLDVLSTRWEPVFEGRIDVTSADGRVLATVPELSEEERAKILESRPDVSLPVDWTGPSEGESLTKDRPDPTTSWLWSQRVFPIDDGRWWDHRFTSGSVVRRFHAIGFTDDDRVVCRIEVILDVSSRLPVVRSWLRTDRWGGSVLLEQLGRGGEEKSLPTVGIVSPETSR